MNCPRCQKEMQNEVYKDMDSSVVSSKCNSCGGAWFDQTELSRIENVREPVFLEIRHIPSEKEQLKALSCPSCGSYQLLEKAEHPRDNKVIIDFCPSCKGIWLDQGELEAIQKENWLITLGKIFKWFFGEN